MSDWWIEFQNGPTRIISITCIGIAGKCNDGWSMDLTNPSINDIAFLFKMQYQDDEWLLWQEIVFDGHRYQLVHITPSDLILIDTKSTQLTVMDKQIINRVLDEYLQKIA